jgi:hypothetical protein
MKNLLPIMEWLGREEGKKLFVEIFFWGEWME